jgi:hypothetical protein
VESEKRLSRCRIRLELYDQLESMECGLKELTLLKNIILEISNNNSINPHFAFKKFCSDLKDQYDAKLGLQKKIDEMNTSLIHARQELHPISLEYSKLRDLNNKLEELNYGVSQGDIVCWNNIVKGYTKDLSSMNEDLIQYGGLVNAKTHLDSKVKSLSLESVELSAKVQVLREEGKKISLSIRFDMSHGRKIVQTFFEGFGGKN